MKANVNRFSVVFILFLAGALFADRNSFSLAADKDAPVLRSSVIRDPFLPLYPKKDTEKKTTSMKTTPVVRSAVTTGSRSSEFTVQGLVWGQAIPQAIINNKVVSVGDTIDDAKVIDISKEGVRLLYQNDIILIKPQIAASGKK